MGANHTQADLNIQIRNENKQCVKSSHLVADLWVISFSSLLLPFYSKHNFTLQYKNNKAFKLG